MLALGCALAGLTSTAVLMPGPAMAAEGANGASSREYAIPAGRLSDVLAQFAATAGVPLSFDPQMLRGLHSNGLQGRYSVSEGFSLLLAGSGHELTDTGGGVYSLRPVTPVTTTTTQRETTLPPVTVNAKPIPQPPGLPPAFAGGQVARGGQLGVLGNRDFMDTPLTQSSYTAELMENQQIQHIAEVLNNDPTARATNSASTGLDSFSVRGFDVANADVLFNGMAGVAPSFFNSVMAEAIERVEVLKGPSALLNGAGLYGSVGGTINLIPKRAGDKPLTRFSIGHSSSSQLGGHLDLGRRFGPDDRFGLRINSVHREGNTGIDNQSRRSTLLAIGLDYRGERLRLSSDIGYQDQDFQGTRRFARVAPGVAVPRAPDNRSNFYDPHEFNNTQALYGAARAEYDLSGQWTVFAGLGGNQRQQRSMGTNRTIANAQGDLLAGGDPTRLSADRFSFRSREAGVQGRFVTGAVQHQATLSYTVAEMVWRRSYGPEAGPGFPASNIYHPVYGISPDFSLQPRPGDARRSWQPRNASVTLSDTLSMLDERVQLTLGIRRQDIRSTSYDEVTGAVSGTAYDASATTPMLALLVKPWQRVSLYASYLEGLQEGALVGEDYSNEGELFPPYKTRQHEVGAKFDLGRLAVTASVYQIAMPSAIEIDSASPGGEPALRLNGEQRHRGLDFNAFGEIAKGVRLLGGAAFIDSELTRTQGGINEGNTGVAAPRWRMVAGAEWDTPLAEGLTLSGRVVRTGSQFLDQANTQRISAWTRLDLWARYRIKTAGQRAIVLRANLTNALGKSYWESSSFGQLILSDPRSLVLSASFDL